MRRNHEIVPTTQARPDLLAQDPGARRSTGSELRRNRHCFM